MLDSGLSSPSWSAVGTVVSFDKINRWFTFTLALCIQKYNWLLMNFQGNLKWCIEANDLLYSILVPNLP